MNTVGRRAEMRAVDRFLTAVAEGPAVLVVEGPAGIGKTTVWRAGLAAARERGWAVLSTTAVDAEADLPFVGLRDLSQRLPVELGDHLPPVQRIALDRALLRGGDADVPADPHAVCAAAASVVRVLCEDRPLIVAVDDLPWLDRSTRRLLTYVVRRLRHERVGFLVTRRPEETGPPFGPDGPEPVRVELGALGEEDLRAVLATHTGRVPSARTLRRVHEVSGGNPFYAMEITRAGGPVPDDVLAVTGRRVAALGDAARHALGLAALLSAPTAAQVERVVGAVAVEEAVDSGLLESDGVALRFAHPILRAAVTAGIPALRRRAWHRELAAVVGPGERAWHLAAAATGPDAEVAAALDEAARQAAARGAPDAAADLADRAVALTPPGEDRARRIVTAAVHHYRADDAVAARERLDDLAAELPPGELRAEALMWSGTAWTEDDTDAASARLRRALADVTDGGAMDAISAAAHRQLAVVQVFAGRPFHARAHAEQAVVAATAGGDAASVRESRATLAWARFWNGLGYQEDLLESGAWTRFAPNHKTFGFLRGLLLGLTDDHAAARAALLAEHRDARDRGLDRVAALALAGLADVERHAGDWDRALEHVAEGVLVAQAAGDGLVRALLHQAGGHVRARLGRSAEARADAAAAIAEGERIRSPMAARFGHSLLGFVALTEGDPAAAVRELEPGAAELLRFAEFDPSLARFLPDLVEALVAVGQTDWAAAVLAPYEQRAGAVGRPSGIAAAARCRALLYSATGDPEGAAAAVGRALAADEPAPFERGRSLLVAGSVHRRARRRAQARTVLTEAAELFDGLGSTPWAARAREELARIGGRAPGPTALTEGEERIAALVAEGRSNREVAAELFLAVSSVEAALWRIYRKLGVRSRTELAAQRRA